VAALLAPTNVVGVAATVVVVVGAAVVVDATYVNTPVPVPDCESLFVTTTF
jgi:hypothetical protein